VYYPDVVELKMVRSDENATKIDLPAGKRPKPTKINFPPKKKVTITIEVEE